MADAETLAQRVRRIQRETGSVDPRELAQKVIADLDSEEISDALAEAMPEFVRVTIREVRNHVTSSAPGKSANVAAIRAWYQQLFDQPVDVSGGNGVWKALRNCTREELLTIAQHRREVARRNLMTADMYERLAKFMKAGQTVGLLPEDVVTGVFRGQAAS